MALLDPHSYTDSEQPQTERIDWRARVDFDARILACEAVLHLDREGDELDLDTRDLDVREVTDGAGAALAWKLGPADEILGRRLNVRLAPGVRAVRVVYRTSPSSSALQWLEPAQTAGKREPFLFSQCQAIHARAVVPCQDSPRVRIRYRAELNVPARLRSLMAAGFVGRSEAGARAVDRWEMPQPIPPYLLALAVGDLVSRDFDQRSRIWAEPETIEAAAWEFEATPSLVRAGEALFGAYPWDRFDILVMPPSFPYGGMENPRLTFVTPTLIAGDRTQVSVIAHELAHSWTGNLVTNANAEHFWLNEGWTRYAEIRLVEATEGTEVAALHAALGVRNLERELERFRAEGRPELTRLRTQLAGVDPDLAFSGVPYDKGYLLLRAMEERVGRPRFDELIRKYIGTFAFRAITTEEFVAFTDRELPGVLGEVRADEWMFAPGVPPDAPRIRSAILDALADRGATPPDAETAARWSPAEWELWLEWLPRPAPRDLLDRLHARLDAVRNPEVLVAWLTVAAESAYPPAYPRIEQVLKSVGRMKYLRPLYSALASREATRPLARRIFDEAAPGYHPIARAVMDRVIAG